MRLLCVVMTGMILLGAGGGAQRGGESAAQTVPAPMPPGAGFPPLARPGGEGIAISPELARKQEQVRNTERQKRLVQDTDKLLALATDLKQEVDKTNKDVLSVEVIKKAEEIEKLAHSVKERMKG